MMTDEMLTKEQLSKNAYTLSQEALFASFHTSEKGLPTDEAKKRLQTFGFNRLTAKKKISALALFLGQFKNTLTMILILAAFLMFFIYFFGDKDTSDLVEGGLILAIVLMITLLGFVQEFKAEKAIESLKKLLAYRAKVIRDGRESEIDVSELVPGDIVLLEEGVKVPADIRLLQVFSMNVNEASLTGESAPVTKITTELPGEIPITDQRNMVFAGTVISVGRGSGVVVQTGDATEIGKIAKNVAETVDTDTPIQKRLDKIGKIIGYIILAICVVVFVFIMFFAREFGDLPFLQRGLQSFIAAVALAVAAIPEGLPAVVTIALALGTQRMLRKNALVRKLNSVETLGSTDTICSDKTGTLTKGEMTVKKIFFDGIVFDITGTGYETEGEFQRDGKKVDVKKLALLLEIGKACSNASITDEKKVLGDPTEAALLVSAAKGEISTTYERVTEIPFSSERKMMSVVIKKEKNYFVYIKGATEVVLAHSTKLWKEGGVSELVDAEKKVIMDMNQTLSTQALRNLGFAYKELTPEEFEKEKNDPTALEAHLIFVGIQGMIDPPRVEVKPLVEACQQSGIRIIMITGDHVETAKAVAREIGIIGDALSGIDLEKIDEKAFGDVVEKVSIYARVNPAVKMRIVEALQKKGHIVAMTGDGVNDAPALKKADIGIAMGITGTDVAKEASDMVLLDDHFSTIVKAIEEGRGIFHNIRKFVTYLLSCNIGEVLVVFFGVMIFQDLVVTAIMLLWINVVTDGIPAVALGLDPAEKGIMQYKPQQFQTQIVNRKHWVEMTLFGILLTIATLGMYQLNLSRGFEFAQSIAFVTIVVLELVNIYLIRSAYRTSVFSNGWLFIAILGTVLLQLAIMYIPFLANVFGLVPIGIIDWGIILGLSVMLWFSFSLLRGLLQQIPLLQQR